MKVKADKKEVKFILDKYPTSKKEIKNFSFLKTKNTWKKNNYLIARFYDKVFWKKNNGKQS